MNALPYMRPQDHDRFWSKVHKTPTCWLWVGSRTPRGYGAFHLMVEGRKTPFRAHRVAWEIAFGLLPNDTGRNAKGTLVLHRCDVVGCVNPEHLFVGDQKANMADAKAKGRCYGGSRHWNYDAAKKAEVTARTKRRYGFDNPRSRFTPEQGQVLADRHAGGEPVSAIAKDVGADRHVVARTIRLLEYTDKRHRETLYSRARQRA